MTKAPFIVIVVLVLLLPYILASGSVQTGNLLPASVDLCGDYAQYVTITASSIFNRENTSLQGLTARLIVAGNPGLNFITPQDISLGNINPVTSAGSASWTLQCSTPSAGLYTAYVNYTSQNGFKGSSSDEKTTLITVHETVPFQGNISIIEGAGQQNEQNYEVVSDNTPTLKVTTTRNAVCKGSLDTDEFYQDMDFMFYGIQKDHNYTFVTPISEGAHSVYVKCKDEFENTMPASLEIYFIVDTSAPVITVISPASVVAGEYTDLAVSVTENADCRYDTEDDSFKDMAEFEIINKTVFSVELTELKEKRYEYFIKCQDKSGNTAEKEIDFDVELPPKARIILEKASPLTKGTYELRLITTKKLRSVPELSYAFTDDIAFSRQVNLIKEGADYKGYIIIEDSEKVRSGEFSFSGFDLSGNEGTEITEGGIFLVDTIKPNAPDTLQGAATDEGINLEWFYDGEKPDRFNIYRSASQGVGPINLYDTSSKQEFLDENVANSQVYYYRVAAVDKAGNIGTLSNEISVYAKSGSAKIGDTPLANQNPPTQQTRDWKTKTEKDLDSIIIDLEWALNNLKDQATKEKSVEDLSLVKDVMSAQEEIAKAKSALKGIDLPTVSDTDLRETLSKTDALVARTKKTIPQSLKVEKATTVLQATAPAEIESLIAELLGSTNFTESQIKSYTREMQNLNTKVKVEAEIKTLTIEYLDAGTENKVLVTKTFTYEDPNPLADAIAIELVPKTVAGDISGIDIRTPDYSVVKADPIFSWSYPALTYDKQSFTYVLLSTDTSEAAKNTRTIIILDPAKIIKPDSNIMTGFTIFFSGIASNGIQVIGLVIGFLIILGLSMYYIVVINEVNIGVYLKKVPLLNRIVASSGYISAPGKNGQNDKTSSQAQKAQQPIIKNNNEVQAVIQVEQGQQPSQPDTSRFSMEGRNFNYLFKADNPIKTIPEQYFFVKNGDVIRSITEIVNVLENMDDFTFYYHAHDNRNDFANWVETVYHNKELGDLIRGISSRKELIVVMKELMKEN